MTAVLRRPLLFGAAAAMMAKPADAIMPMLPGLRPSATSSTPTFIASVASIFTNTSPFTSSFTEATLSVGDIFIWTVGVDSGVMAASVSGTPSFSAFQQRAAFTSSTGGGITTCMSVWWASVTGSTTAFSITTVMSTPSYDDVVAIALQVRGVYDPANPFDPNPKLPVMAAFPVSATGSVTFSTSNSVSLCLFSFGGATVPWVMPPPTVVAPSAWVWENGQPNPGGHFAMEIGVYGQTASTVLSSASASITTTLVNNAVFIVDALTGNPGGVP